MKGSSQTKSVSDLEIHLARILERRRKALKLRVLKSSPSNSVDFSSNDFLSLSTNQDFRRDFLHELQNQILPVGSTGSRLLDGNSEYAEHLERTIAKFHNSKSALLVGSGFDANVSIFTCLPQPGDTILYDRLIHASVHDGMRASRAKAVIPFEHNCLVSFRESLSQCLPLASQQNVFVALESVYSMDGDLAPLAEMVAVMKELIPSGRCHMIVDEAHATGVYGENGQGRVNDLGLEDDVLIRLITYGKALASNGAAILCSNTIRSYLLNYARPLIYTTFLSYPNLTAIKVVYDWMIAGRTIELAANLRLLISYLHQKLRDVSSKQRFEDHCGMIFLDETPQSAIFALRVADPRSLADFCQKAGYIVRAVMSPTVPKGTERVRICLHAGNTINQIDTLLSHIALWLDENQKPEQDFSSTLSQGDSFARARL